MNIVNLKKIKALEHPKACLWYFQIFLFYTNSWDCKL